ncbi:MAG: hypothetical protein OXR66_01395 [Candidatus Woesearchaeota archaeon]|nr:hypothetical protein [Candidatus Woesearchaeota archaeon]
MADHDKIFALLTPQRIREEQLKHDTARETFTAPAAVTSAQEADALLTRYVQHHTEQTGQRISPEDALQKARDVLGDQYVETTRSSPRQALDSVAAGMKKGAQAAYLDRVYEQHIEPLSQHEQRAFNEAVTAPFQGFGEVPDPATTHPRKILDYHARIGAALEKTAKKF